MGTRVGPTVLPLKKKKKEKEEAPASAVASTISFLPSVQLMTFEEWILLPKQLSPFHVAINRMLMPLKWSFWTNRSLLAVSDGDAIRARLGNQYSVLGSSAGMLVTISAAAFCLPPTASSDRDVWFISVFGVCMFLSSMLFIGYIVISLTVLFPLIESSRDELAPHILLDLFRDLRNMDSFLFVLGVNAFALGLLAIVPVAYSMEVFYVAIAITVCVYGFVIEMGVSSFIAVDPITALHMGLSRDAAVIERARKHADILEHLLISSPDPPITIHDDSSSPITLPPASGRSNKPAESRVSATLKSHAKRIRPAAKQEPLSLPFQPQLMTHTEPSNRITITSPSPSPITSPSLEQIFLGRDRLSGPYIRSQEESARVLGRIAAAGFDTADDFRSFLHFLSQQQQQGDSSSTSSSSARYHQVSCLVEMGVTVGHAYKIVLLFDSLDCWDDDDDDDDAVSC